MDDTIKLITGFAIVTFWILVIGMGAIAGTWILGLLAPITMFWMKAGLIKAPVQERPILLRIVIDQVPILRGLEGDHEMGDNAILWSLRAATVITFLGIFGAFAMYNVVITQSPEIFSAYVAKYASSECQRPFPGMGPDCALLSFWHVTLHDAPPFFVATFLLLYARAATARARRAGKSLWLLLAPAVIGAFIFLHFYEYMGMDGPLS